MEHQDKVDILFEVMKSKFIEINSRFDKQDDQLDQLIKFRWMILGGAATVGSIGGFIAALATLYFYSKGMFL